MEVRVRPTQRASAAAVATCARKSLFPFLLSLFPAVASARANPEANALRREASTFAFHQARNVPSVSILGTLCRTKDKDAWALCGRIWEKVDRLA